MNSIAFRELAVALTYEDAILIVGGESKSSQQPATISENSILMFNTTQRKWSVLLTQSPSFIIPNPGGALTAQIIENYIWIFGGDNSVAAETATNIYSLGPLSDIKNGKALVWNRFPIPTGLNIHNSRSASVVWNKELYFYGGEYWSKTSTPPVRTGKTWIYNTASNQWREGVPLPVADHTAFTAIVNRAGQVFSFGGWELALGFVNFGFTGHIGESLKRVSTSPLSIPARDWSCLTYYNNSFMVYSGLFPTTSSENPLLTYWWNGTDGAPWTMKTTSVASNNANLAIPNWYSVTCSAINNTLYVFGSPSDAAVRSSLETSQRYIFALDLNTLEWFDPATKLFSTSSNTVESTSTFLTVGIILGGIILVLIVIAAVLAILYWRLRSQTQRNTSLPNMPSTAAANMQWQKQQQNDNAHSGSYPPVSSSYSSNADTVEVVGLNAQYQRLPFNDPLNISNESTTASSPSSRFTEDHPKYNNFME
ncbi:hypothetical protein HK098_002508 [Nowakowskiella sp. JEL0407]|nr:hypothetical protein HK098_002508 [Nowakowskiella sp. JEL0407]